MQTLLSKTAVSTHLSVETIRAKAWTHSQTPSAFISNKHDNSAVNLKVTLHSSVFLHTLPVNCNHVIHF